MSVIDFIQKNGELLEQLALFVYLKEGEESKDLYESIVGCRFFNQLWKRFSEEDQTEHLREETISAIAQYIQTHPRATQEEIKHEVAKQIVLFAQKIQ